jgi:hypothetical protein
MILSILGQEPVTILVQRFRLPDVAMVGTLIICPNHLKIEKRYEVLEQKTAAGKRIIACRA